MKKNLLLIFFLLLPTLSHATAQFPDKLIYDGANVDIHTNPLESYFNSVHPKPKDLSQSACTAVWRGYIATWEIKDKKLYLTKIVEGSCDENPKEIPLSMIFKGQKGPIEATWYTGTLVIPQGKLLRYEHMGYESVYETEMHILIKKGKVEAKKVIDNTITKPPVNKQ